MTRRVRPPDPAAYIDALVAGLPDEQREGRWMIMLQAYLDDSGSEPNSPIYCLAGYLANVGQWKRFSPAWKAALLADPSIDYFKMSEAMDLRGQFEGIPSALRDQKVFSLAEITHKHIEARINITIGRDDFDIFLKPTSDWPEVQDPYFICFYALVVMVNAFHRRIGLPDVEIDFIFDEQGNIGKRAVGWWDILLHQAGPDRAKLLGSAPIFRNDRKFLPLQAADMYAWVIRDRLIKGRDQALLPKAVLKMFTNKVPLSRHLNKGYLMGLGAKFIVKRARERGHL